jgi:hypothetical protein
MGFQPSAPVGGIAGWRFLQRTEATQRAAFEKGPELARELAYFESKIGQVSSAADLVADRRLLKVALGAFGLEGDIDKRAFVRQVLESDLADPRALASRLTAPAYKKINEAFGFGAASGPNTGKPGFAATIASAYRTRAFEVALGQSSNDLRLALNFRREIVELSKGAEGGSWFSVLASKPLREVFEKAYGLPKQFGQIDVDRQRDILRDRTDRVFGTDKLTAFADPANVEKLLTRFLARAQIEAGVSATAPGAGALALFGATGASASQGLLNLLASRR